ncbi:MAG: DUF5914 domain-containing protein [Spirochaetaceae bacterium]|nr:DUF5914 domain-containing protein [Spirochaetaceae bacterium]
MPRRRAADAVSPAARRRGRCGPVRAAGLVRRGMERRAHRLWVEDAAYAERRYALCTGNV